jgi:hypothetical protein
MENVTQWESVANAPLDRDLELAVIDALADISVPP